MKLAPLDAEDTVVMMQLLKIARMNAGGDDVDDDIDNVGYAAKLAEVRAVKRAQPGCLAPRNDKVPF